MSQHFRQDCKWTCESMDKRMDAIEAERDRLIEANKNLCRANGMDALQSEIDRLRADHSVALGVIDNLKAELEGSDLRWNTQAALKDAMAKDRYAWKQKAEKLAEALRAIKSCLSGGQCKANKCEGCSFEMGEAVEIAKAALDEYGEVHRPGVAEAELLYSGQCRHRIPIGQSCKECGR